jgi:pimeloyl-ACP methyl ester carboxylesterase
MLRKLFLVSILAGVCVPVHAAPCTTLTSACMEWVNLGTSQSRSLIYRTYPLGQFNDKIKRALIVVHGAGRDADNYFRTALAAAFLADALDDTILIAPRFASNDGAGCADVLEPNEVNWRCDGDSWRSGGTAMNDEKLTSYDFADEIIRRLARKNAFPNLQTIVVSGHSAGGQFVTRYEMANQIHEKAGIPISYVVANPSSYAYLDSARPQEEDRTQEPFADARNCTTYDNWPYGLKRRTGYAARLTDAQLKKQLASRPVTYLLGQLDTLPLAGFDSSCPAMAQGPSRLSRGQAFANYVNRKYNAQHKVMVVPLCGHNARCMFTAEPVLPVLFPTQN